MAVTALIKFSQGLVIGSPGVAFKGVVGTPVSIENGSPVDVASWKIDLVYAPPGSGVIPGTLATGNTNTPFAQFVPGAQPGSYRVQLTVYSDINQSGSSNKDIRVFAVPHSSGIVFPPYQNLPSKLPVTGSGVIGEKPDEMNFSSQEFGWDGNGGDGLLLDFMRQVAGGSLGGGGGGTERFSIKVVPEGETQIIPAGSEMLYTGTLDGDYDVNGELTEIADAAGASVPWTPLWKADTPGNYWVNGDTVDVDHGQVAMFSLNPGDAGFVNLPVQTPESAGRFCGGALNDKLSNGQLLFQPQPSERINGHGTGTQVSTADNSDFRSVIFWADGNGSWLSLAPLFEPMPETTTAPLGGMSFQGSATTFESPEGQMTFFGEGFSGLNTRESAGAYRLELLGVAETNSLAVVVSVMSEGSPSTPLVAVYYINGTSNLYVYVSDLAGTPTDAFVTVTIWGSLLELPPPPP